jgi:hypothetical protein
MAPIESGQAGREKEKWREKQIGSQRERHAGRDREADRHAKRDRHKHSVRESKSERERGGGQAISLTDTSKNTMDNLTAGYVWLKMPIKILKGCAVSA